MKKAKKMFDIGRVCWSMWAVYVLPHDPPVAMFKSERAAWQFILSSGRVDPHCSELRHIDLLVERDGPLPR